jgi:hypothetical protein
LAIAILKHAINLHIEEDILKAAIRVLVSNARITPTLTRHHDTTETLHSHWKTHADAFEMSS